MKMGVVLSGMLAVLLLYPMCVGAFIDRVSNIVNQIKEEANFRIANADAEIARIEAQSVNSPSTMLRAFKKSYPEARAQATSRVACEWMTNRMKEEAMNGRLPSGEMTDTICEELPKREPIPNCNFPTVNKFRTIDGTCNNLQKQTLGAAFTPFSRILPAVYEDGIGQPVGFEQTFLLGKPFEPPRPSPRLISVNVTQSIESSITQPSATLMLMQWGQFLDHDYAYLIESSTLSGEETECKSCEAIGECLPIPVPDDDVQFGLGTKQNGNCLPFIRSGVSYDGELCPRQQINQITHWIDASNVYGSLQVEEDELRAFKNGLLKEGLKPGTLPADPDPRLPCPGPVKCFRAGDLRSNEQVVLTVIHTIFLREHNRIAEYLQALNPQWNDERIYQEARKIVGAENQFITYQEYLPEILGKNNLLHLLGKYEGYDPSLAIGLPNSFATAAYRFGHSQVPEYFERLDRFDRPLPQGPLQLLDAFFNPGEFFNSGGTDPLLRGLLSQNSRQVDEFVNANLTNGLFAGPDMPGMDLAALNIQRGRDHGLPSYREFRNFCTKKYQLRGEIKNPETLLELQNLYNSHEDIDLWVGGLAEDPLPGAIIGPTFVCLFAITFKALREGDRFYYENPGVFTPEQLAEIRKTTLSRIVCDTADNILNVQPNAFSTTDEKIPCTRLPSIDLSKWLERPKNCYMKVLLNSPTRAQAYLYTKLDDGLEWNIADQKWIMPGTSATCLQFTCPTDADNYKEFPITSDNFRFAIRARRLQRICRISSVARTLPGNSKRSSFTYYGTQLPMFGRQHGFYHEINTCRSSVGAAIAFNCN